MIQDRFDLISCIQELKKDCADFDASARWFVFGSYPRGRYVVSDIDVLVLANDASNGGLIRSVVEEGFSFFPIDLTIMTHSEESFLNFLIRTEACEI